MTRAYAHAGPEPPLEAVLRDPIVRAVMRRDGIELSEVERVIAAARRRLFPEDSMTNEAAGRIAAAGGQDAGGHRGPPPDREKASRVGLPLV